MQAPYLHTTVLNRRQLLQWLGAATTGLTLVACAEAAPSAQPEVAASPASQPQRGGLLRIAFADTLTQLDPALAVSNAEIAYGFTVFENLTSVDYTDPAYPVIPLLAESWATSEDGRVWTFQLRAGVKFHHDAPLTAADVVYTMQRILDPALGSAGNSQLQLVEAVTAVDERQVQFTLRSPHVEFPRVLSTFALQIVPQGYTSEQLAATPSGTGPFRVQSHTAGERLVLVRNEAYWEQPLPYLDEVQHLYITDPSAQQTALLGETVDLLAQVSAPTLALLQAGPPLTIIEYPLGFYPLFAMRTDQPPFDDMRVRQALKHAVDRDALRKVVWREHGTAGNDQPVSPASPFWADAPALAYDVAKAKALLAEAGYADGLTVSLAVAEITPGIVDAAVVLQEMAKAAGITITLERTATDSYWAEKYMQTPFFVSFWPGLADPDEILTFGYHSQGFFNESGWSKPELDQAIEAARAESDPANRQALYADIQRVIATEGGVLIPYFSPQFMAMRNTVQAVPPFVVPLVRGAWLVQES
jgi:peptide/nickel transport system substrate-binding protein